MKTAIRPLGPVAHPAPSSAELVRELLRVWRDIDPDGADERLLSGQLLRPRLAVALTGPDRPEVLEDSFWRAMLAVQLAHEASLLHDDVVDGSTSRRGSPTLVERQGVGAALIMGDRLLAKAYLAASATGSLGFVERFTRTIDAVISGELAQGRTTGHRLALDEMKEIARGKSGELFGCALAAAPTLSGDDGTANALADLGREIGVLYQAVDDLLDYCPSTSTGKSPFNDFSNGLWTWPRAFLPDGATPEAFPLPHRDGIPARRSLAHLESEADALRQRIRTLGPQSQVLEETIQHWLARARDAVGLEIDVASAEVGNDPARRPASHSAPLSTDAPSILATHGRSFHFATRLMPEEVRQKVAAVYAFCRSLDDAVDLAPSPEVGASTLLELLISARRAYDRRGGDPASNGEDAPEWILRAMRDLRESGLPFSLVEQLAAGIRMDLEPTEYANLEELRIYTHRVAGVVGLWIAGLAGCRNEWALHCAAELGHAMQLTNIVRDVGEDLGRGRVYLPRDLMLRHRLDVETLRRTVRETGPVPPNLASLLEEMMGWADTGYGVAFQAIPHLPSPYRRAVAVAARVYQGIHRSVRANDYDVLRHRAHTGRLDKLILGLGSLRELARTEARAAP